MTKAPEAGLDALIALALAEDIGSGDLTGEATVGPAVRARATITQKAPGVLFGYQAAEAVFRRLDESVEWRAVVSEGSWRDDVPAVAVELLGNARALLAGERTALNFLQRLSGIATATAIAVAEIEGTGVELLDTRKTTPGMRLLEKQAVVAGGGHNHRMGLYDAMLVKENNVALSGGDIREATERALRARPAGIPIEVECRTLAEAEAAIDAGADRLLLDNMSPDQLREAVEMVGGRAELEASGGITIATIREVAGTGVQFISSGSLTHSAPALDLSMSIEPE